MLTFKLLSEKKHSEFTCETVQEMIDELTRLEKENSPQTYICVEKSTGRSIVGGELMLVKRTKRI